MPPLSLSLWRISFLGPFRSCQPQFKDPHHLERLIRRLSASSIWGRMRFCAGRRVRSWRRVLWFCRAPPGPPPRAFARGWVGSRYRAGKCMGGDVLYEGLSNPSSLGGTSSDPLVGPAVLSWIHAAHHGMCVPCRRNRSSARAAIDGTRADGIGRRAGSSSVFVCCVSPRIARGLCPRLA